MRRKLSLLGLSLCLLLPGPALPALAQQTQTQQTTPQTPPASGGSTLLGPLPRIQLGENEDFALPLQLLLLLTILSLAPAIIILTTSFTRLVVIFSILRTALGLQQSPPTQVLIGLALFLTLFIMYPVFDQIHDEALRPYLDGEITQQVALERAAAPLRAFMLRQTREKDLMLFMDLANVEAFDRPEDVPFYILVPAFVISELRIAFQIGFMIFLPFLLVDLIVASVLMSMGMMMLPPVMISLPLKLLLFVLADGWYLVVESVVRGYLGG
ncbi:flagellar type III secretion system pore protein FliP [Rhodothermus marinus]|uniref:Flagellar biosynthetic protein FliP n=1 Tax=Rhodothermus marinus (strain ATCC 43812 / DSM 4252 / R-10) TaxID=518766 RepID=D0MGA7_RHOM4|nr:flagellar type III secretion system pore protein FliP [Rhodothermus marinus]ACY47663.1 flagellar biosynthetic protein FliP [Rhodothermus marinus DSM 4252]